MRACVYMLPGTAAPVYTVAPIVAYQQRFGFPHVCCCSAAVTIVYGFLQVAAGGKFVGPLGLSILWTIYHALAPWLLLYYSILPFQHEVAEKKCWYMTGRTLFNGLCNLGFILSFGCFIASVVLAFLSGEDSFKNPTSKDHLGLKDTFSHL